MRFVKIKNEDGRIMNCLLLNEMRFSASYYQNEKSPFLAFVVPEDNYCVPCLIFVEKKSNRYKLIESAPFINLDDDDMDILKLAMNKCKKLQNQKG